MPAGRTAAFGDGNNDLEMLEWAAHSVAMGDGVAEIQDLADEVTFSVHEDGVAQSSAAGSPSPPRPAQMPVWGAERMMVGCRRAPHRSPRRGWLRRCCPAVDRRVRSPSPRRGGWPVSTASAAWPPLYVVINHIFLAPSPAIRWTTRPGGLGWFMYGRFAVVVFIVLSGFSLGVSPARPGWRLGAWPRTRTAGPGASCRRTGRHWCSAS